MIEVATTISLVMLTFAGLLSVVKILRPGSLPDRTVALDTLLVVFSAGLAVLAARTGEDTYLNAMVVAALLGFTGTSLVARYIERRGA